MGRTTCNRLCWTVPSRTEMGMSVPGDFRTSTVPHFAKVRVAGSNPVVRSI